MIIWLLLFDASGNVESGRPVILIEQLLLLYRLYIAEKKNTLQNQIS